HEQNYSDAIAYEIDQEMQEIIRSCYNRAKELLTEHEDKVHLLANTLLERETLDFNMIKQLMETGKLDEPEKTADGGEGAGTAEAKGHTGSPRKEGVETADTKATGGGPAAEPARAPEAEAKADAGQGPTAAPGMEDDVKVNIQSKPEGDASNKLDFDKDEENKKGNDR